MARQAPIRGGAAPLLGVLLASGGCAVGPTFTAPQTTLTTSWRAAGDPRVTTQGAVDNLWWKAFGDPALDRLVALAQRENLPLQIAGLRILEARAQYGVATGRQFPQTQALFASGTAVGLTEQVSRYTGLPRNLLAGKKSLYGPPLFK